MNGDVAKTTIKKSQRATPAVRHNSGKDRYRKLQHTIEGVYHAWFLLFNAPDSILSDAVTVLRAYGAKDLSGKTHQSQQATK
jgi:hypothetical protein